MNILMAREGLLQSEQGKAIVRKYNRVALALTEYEIVHYRAWVENIDTVQNILQVCCS